VAQTGNGMSKKIVICDLDGTLTDCAHRRHWVSPDIVKGDLVKRKYTHGPDRRNYIVKWIETPKQGVPVAGLEAVDGSREIDECIIDIKKVKRWDKFFEEVSKDPPITPIIDLVKHLCTGYKDSPYNLIFMSGRPEKTRKDTLEWLRDNGLCYRFITPNGEVRGTAVYDTWETLLYMRPDNDTREDFVVKQELYEKHIKGQHDVAFVLDDRDQVVKLWRSLGLTCLQVAEGNF